MSLHHSKLKPKISKSLTIRKNQTTMILRGRSLNLSVDKILFLLNFPLFLFFLIQEDRINSFCFQVHINDILKKKEHIRRRPLREPCLFSLCN